MTARWALLATIAACGDPAAHVSLAPVSLPKSCGRPQGATGIRVTAFTPAGDDPRAVGVSDSVDLSGFASDTEQLGVEVSVGAGALGATGKTMPLAFGDLDEGDAIPIVMLPPGGFCETAGFLTTARKGPLLARAGSGVLVVGGRGPNDEWLTTAELYDPATATFTEIPVPDVLGGGGFAGTSLVTLPDGKVVISGGPQSAMTVFDAETRTFGEIKLIESRAFHASIATGGAQVLLAGGCMSVSNGACSGSVRNSSKIYDTTHVTDGTMGPTLHAARFGATVLDLGVLDDGRHSYILAGGSPSPSAPDPDTADLVRIGQSDADLVTGLHAQVALLDGGAVISAFSPDGTATPMQGASLLAPGATAARNANLAPALTGVRLVTLEDGRVAGLGGDGANVQLYDPTRDRWSVDSPADAPALSAPSLLQLPDGSVLVIDGGAASQIAYLYRPSLVGASSGSVTVSATSGTNVLTPSDPATVSRAMGFELDGDLARALVGGPRNATGSVAATVRVQAGGVALLAEQTSPGEVIVAELSPGAKARIVRHAAGTTRVLCTGDAVPLFDAAFGVTPRLEIAGTQARLSLGDDTLASCDVGTTARGAWGVAALGEGARVAVDTVTVAR